MYANKWGKGWHWCLIQEVRVQSDVVVGSSSEDGQASSVVVFIQSNSWSFKLSLHSIVYRDSCQTSILMATATVDFKTITAERKASRVERFILCWQQNTWRKSETASQTTCCVLPKIKRPVHRNRRRCCRPQPPQPLRCLLRPRRIGGQWPAGTVSDLKWRQQQLPRLLGTSGATYSKNHLDLCV